MFTLGCCINVEEKIIEKLPRKNLAVAGERETKQTG